MKLKKFTLPSDQDYLSDYKFGGHMKRAVLFRKDIIFSCQKIITFRIG